MFVAILMLALSVLPILAAPVQNQIGSAVLRRAVEKKLIDQGGNASANRHEPKVKADAAKHLQLFEESSSIAYMLPRDQAGDHELVPWNATASTEKPNGSDRPLFGHRNCSPKQVAELKAAIRTATSYLAEANRFLSNPSSSKSKRYITWFGAPNKARWTTVKTRFLALQGHPAKFRYDCSCQRDTLGYVYPNTFGVVYLCRKFWRMPAPGLKSRPGTIIHEAMHFTRLGGAKDFVYGAQKTLNLAKTDPNKAINNFLTGTLQKALGSGEIKGQKRYMNDKEESVVDETCPTWRTEFFWIWLDECN